jgi:predicted acetyltransferase
MVFFPGYDFKYGDNYGRLGYICGAATLPAFRGRGIMGELLSDSFDEMKQRGDSFSSLIPASDSLYSYYERFGYHEFFYRKRYVVARASATAGSSFGLIPMDNFDTIYDIYSEAVTRLRTVVIQSRETYSSVAEEFILSGGDIYISDDRRLYCFVRKAGEILRVREMFSMPDDHIDPWSGLVRSLLKKFPSIEAVEVEAPADHLKAGSSVIRTGMLKVLNEEADSLLLNDHSGYMKFMLED